MKFILLPFSYLLMMSIEEVFSYVIPVLAADGLGSTISPWLSLYAMVQICTIILMITIGDRFDARYLVSISLSVLSFLFILMIVFDVANLHPYGQLTLAIIIISVSVNICSPLMQKSAAQITQSNELQRMVGIMSLAEGLVKIVVPIIIVVLSIRWFAINYTYWIAAAALSCVIIYFYIMTVSETRGISGSKTKESVRHLYQYIVVNQAWFISTALLFSLSNATLAGLVKVALVKHSIESSDDELYTKTLMMVSVGGLLAAVSMMVLTFEHKKSDFNKFPIVFAVLLAISGIAQMRLVFLVEAFLMGFMLVVFAVKWNTQVQASFPIEKLGRVNSLDMLLSLSLLPVGYYSIEAISNYLSFYPLMVVVSLSISVPSMVLIWLSRHLE